MQLRNNNIVFRVITPLILFLIVFALYLNTLNPVFHANDSPETIACAYTLGIQKSWNGKAAGYCLGLEVTQLGRSMTTLGRGSPPYYTHHRVRQGYTHDGMILGAGIGPGSESQSLALTRLSDRGAVEASFTRIRWDNDAYYSEIVSQRGFWGHDVSNILSIESIVLLDRFVLHPGIAYTWRMNRNFKTDGDAHNLRFSITVSAPIH